MANFPTSLDNSSTIPNPTGTDTQNSPDHASLHTNTGDAVKAVQAKVGIGASTPVANTFLFGTGTGTSAWTVATSAQVAAAVSDETGSGSLVFATTPTLVTPKVDTINESTPANGVTIDGLNIKDSAITTANAIGTTNITNASVTASKLATGAASALVDTAESTASTSYADLATVGPTVTVTIGVNGVALVSIYSYNMLNTGTSRTHMGFAVSGATTQAAADNYSVMVLASSANVPQIGGSAVFVLTGLTPGATTFTAKYKVAASSSNFQGRRIAVVPL